MKEEANHYVIAVLSPSIIDNRIFCNWSAIFPTLAYQDPGAHGELYNRCSKQADTMERKYVPDEHAAPCDPSPWRRSMHLSLRAVPTHYYDGHTGQVGDMGPARLGRHDEACRKLTFH